jgi:hypothetical protein
MKNYEKINENLPNIYVNLDNLFILSTDMEQKEFKINRKFIEFLYDCCADGNLIILSKQPDEKFLKMVKILDMLEVRYDGWNNEDMDIDLSHDDSMYIDAKVDNIMDYVKEIEPMTVVFEAEDLEEMKEEIEEMKEEIEEDKEEMKESFEQLFEEVKMDKEDKTELTEMLKEFLISEKFKEIIKDTMKEIIQENNKKED